MNEDQAHSHEPDRPSGPALRLVHDRGGADRSGPDGPPASGPEHGSTVYYDRLLLPEDKHLRFIEVRDIVWVEADGNYVRIHARDEEHLIRRKLGEVAELLDPRRFVRIHRSTVVNLEEIDHLVPWFSGGYLVRLRTGQELKISRHYAAKLTALEWWVG